MDSASMDFRAIAWERGWSFTSLSDELGLTCTQVSNRVHQVVPWRLPGRGLDYGQLPQAAAL